MWQLGVAAWRTVLKPQCLAGRALSLMTSGVCHRCRRGGECMCFKMCHFCPGNSLMYAQKKLQCGDFLPFSSLESKWMDAESEVCGFE